MLIGKAPARMRAAERGFMRRRRPIGRGRARQAHVVLEALQVALGLEADQVVGGTGREQPRGRGSAASRSDDGIGTCRKKPIRLLHAALAQLAGQRDQVVVVHPDEVVMLQQRRQLLGEQRVDAR